MNIRAFANMLMRLSIGCCIVVCAYQIIHFSRSVPIEDHPTIEQELDAAMADNATPIKYSAVGSPAQDLRAKYAAAYDHARKLKLSKVDHCEACGKTAAELKRTGQWLETHHVVSVQRIFQEGLDPALIGDPENLIVLHRDVHGGCHLCYGHDEDGPSGPKRPSWSTSNPNVRMDAAKFLRKANQ